MFFTPRHIKSSVQFRKGVEKFIHYKRHLLSASALDELRSKLAGLRAMEIDRTDRATLAKAQEELENACKRALPNHAKPPGWLAENVEVLFTAIVIALGIRAYFLQPFKIPTGSMQPTLNGIIARPMPEPEAFPSPAVRAWQWLWNGRSYVHVKASRDDVILRDRETSLLLFFTTTRLETRSGDTIKIPASQAAARQQLGLDDFIQAKLSASPQGSQGGIPVKAGETIVRGWVQGGDQLLVDKMSYHFRKPKRGEVFVFNTKGIKGIESSPSFRPEFGSQHYIKRLCAVPGDTVSIRPGGDLLINGERPQGRGFDAVLSKKDGYHGYLAEVPDGNGAFHSVPLKEYSLRPGGYEASLPRFWSAERQPQPAYWAMGDNQASSADSRYWGPVPQMNVVGPALVVYWPLGNHGGLIH